MERCKHLIFSSVWTSGAGKVTGEVNEAVVKCYLELPGVLIKGSFKGGFRVILMGVVPPYVSQ